MDALPPSHVRTLQGSGHRIPPSVPPRTPRSLPAPRPGCSGLTIKGWMELPPEQMGAGPRSSPDVAGLSRWALSERALG